MAANKFATMVHRNTNKLTLILIYAVLEWVLIILLLLNSLFSYLIIKFARYFGLQPPCLLCSRLDHIFDPRINTNPANLVCHHHAAEISKLSYCLGHQKLVHGRYLCEDCSSSPGPESIDGGVFGNEHREEEMGLKCLCCESSIRRREVYSGSSVVKSSWSGDVHVDDRDYMVEGREDGGGGGDDHDHGMLDEFGEFQMVLSLESDQALKDAEKVKIEYDSFARTLSDESGQEKVDLEEKEEKQPEQEQEQEDQQDDDDGDIKKGDCADVVMVDNSSADQDQTMVQVDGGKKKSSGEVLAHHLEFYIDGDECQLIPVDLVEFGVEESQGDYKIRDGDGNCGFEDVILDFCSEARPRTVQRAVLPSIEENEEEEDEDEDEDEEDRGDDTVEDVKVESEKVSDTDEGGLIEEGDRQVAVAQATEDIEKDNDVQGNEKMDGQVASADVHSGDEECNSQDDEINTEVSIGTEIPEQEMIEEIQVPEDLTSHELHKEEQSTSYSNPLNDYNCDDRENDCNAVEFRTILAETGDEAVNLESLSNMEHVDTKDERNCVEFKTVSAEAREESENCLVHSSVEYDETQEDGNLVDFGALSVETSERASDCHLNIETNEIQEDGSTMELKAISAETSEGTTSAQLPVNMEYNETEDEKIPDTPTSVDSLNQLHRKLLLLGRAESGTEESLDGSVISDIEGGEGTVTVEKLKSALRAERKALHALYAELEEERSASAVAASQTMAMINRLQEEKAAMQMEALQYQRMMEEQSEYDQEALQLLNDLMVKREKEKEELEKELEVYRRKVQEYEAKEKMMTLTTRKDGNLRRNSSASCSNAEDSDGSSVDFHEAKEEADMYDNLNGHSHNTPADAVLCLEESLNDFEEERVSILEQLKALEEKLFTIDGAEEKCFKDVKPMHDLFEHSGNGYEGLVDANGIGNGILNGHAKINGTLFERGRLMAPKAKRLLPLFNAVDVDMEDGIERVNGRVDDIDILQSDFMGLGDEKKLAIEEEVDHVYERLQAFEADREFLRHCVSSLKKGDKGLVLLQEILQHLRDLRTVELRARNMEEGIL